MLKLSVCNMFSAKLTKRMNIMYLFYTFSLLLNMKNTVFVMSVLQIVCVLLFLSL